MEGLYEYAQNSLQNSCSQAQFYLSVKLMMNVIDVVKCGQIQDALEPSDQMKALLMHSLQFQSAIQSSVNKDFCYEAELLDVYDSTIDVLAHSEAYPELQNFILDQF